MTKYEIMYIIRPNIEEEEKTALVERFNNVISENDAELLETKDWGKRRLAYEINDFRDGHYMIIKLQANQAKATQEFDRLAKISEDIIRHLIVREEE